MQTMTRSAQRTDVPALLLVDDSREIEGALGRAVRRIAPLWPLKHWVAVNPFLGLADLPFDTAAGTVATTVGARMTMPRRFYREAIQAGRITDADLAAALAAAPRTPGAPRDVAALRAAAAERDVDAAPPLLPTVADVAAEVTGEDWARFATERISGWAGRHFDEGQALWRSPWREHAPFAAWRAEAAIDRTAEVAGVRDFRALVAGLPASPAAAAAAALEALGVPAEGRDAYLHRLAASIGGWAGYARYRAWDAELGGGTDDAPEQLLAIRLVWEWALLEGLAHRGVRGAWTRARTRYAPNAASTGDAGRLAVDLLLHDAYERGWQRDLLGRLHGPRETRPAQRKRVQAAFCIDVRSEVFRRALERVDPGCETIGFAGFFGFSVEYVPLGHDRGGARCPVLLTPQAVIREGIRGAPAAEGAEAAELRILRRRALLAWKQFKLAAVSSFAFVGPVGLAYAWKMVTDALGVTRTVAHPSTDHLEERVRVRLAPELEPGSAGRRTGMDHEQRLATAEGVLRAMSLTDGFARLVLLVGHGSTTVNNPHATGLDCGACGGHTGEANARVAAAVLNDPAVRFGLAARGIVIPDDTHFLPCLHDTTTDEVAIFDEDEVPATLAADLTRLRVLLAAAGSGARAERAALLGVEHGPGADAEVRERSRDWSQVRPEWGLAGCAAFVAAPRHRTEGVDLGGRSFLHSYDWRADEGFGVLELIMTAPMVVASWISMQYFGSTVDNRAFGCGNKTLHNVVGTIGVLEGNGGDLRAGLPWQSVHDGERLVHEPVRLTVVIEAPTEAIDGIVARHESVRQLLDNGWVHLLAMDDAGRVAWRYAGGGSWLPVAAGEESIAA